MLKPCPLFPIAFRVLIAAIALNSFSVHAAAVESAEAPDQEQLFAAALEGKWQPIKAAIEKGYKPNTADPAGRTVLMYAAFNGHAPLVAQLIEAGAIVNQKDQSGSTALMFASSGPFTETVALLLEKGAKINDVDSNEHFSALMWAAAEGQTEVVKLLLNHGADISLKDIDGDTAESFAAKAGHAEIVKVLQAAKPASEESEPKKEEEQS